MFHDKQANMYKTGGQLHSFIQLHSKINAFEKFHRLLTKVYKLLHFQTFKLNISQLFSELAS